MFRVLVLLAACRPDPVDERPGESRHQVVDDSASVLDVDSGLPPEIDTFAEEDVCAGLVLASDVAFSATVAIRTQEDFDFDMLGFLDTQQQVDIVGYTRTGDRHLVAESVGIDPAGIRSLPTGDLVVAMPQTGVLKLVSYETAHSSTIIGGLLNPHGLEAGLDGMIYTTEYYDGGSVRMVDPYTGENELVAAVPYPNGMALSPDDQTLYIATSGGWYGGQGTVAAIDRGPDGAWDPNLRRVYTSPNLIAALATDICGNLYVAETYTGRVFRIRAEDGGLDPLANLSPGPYGLTAARFGHGLGEFRRDQLFVSNRNQVFVLEVGVDGRHVLAGD